MAGMITEELSPEAKAAIREEAEAWVTFNARMEFLRLQAQMPLRLLLLGTTAIMTGKVRT